jgi:NitT/TauT family transport system substrate-binding protein
MRRQSRPALDGSTWSRRSFISRSAAIGISAGLFGIESRIASAEAPPETTRIRFVGGPAICIAPQYVAETLLKAEGFTEVEYVKFDTTNTPRRTVANGSADIILDAVGDVVSDIDAGAPLLTLAGVHLGCYELFGTDRIRAVRDLKGKKISVDTLRGSQHTFLSAMISYVGLDPRKDIDWVVHPSAEAIQLFADGKLDAYLGFPPEPQELRAKKIGHVVVNTATDRPWSQYFCCMMVANRDFVQNNPVAIKRALRATLKAADLCSQDPDRAARLVVQKGFIKNYDYALEALREVSYGAWRTYDPDSTIRFHALRLHEVGMIKNTPDKIIAKGTDWRFLNELRKELKA